MAAMMNWSERATNYAAKPQTSSRDERWEMILADLLASFIRVHTDGGTARIILR
jgi:hypothetical protein